MNNEYLIVNKSLIEKRIEELERLYKNSEKPSIEGNICYRLILQLKQILSQSTPLIPEIEKAFDVGSERCEFGYGNANDKHDYISNLKLDI